MLSDRRSRILARVGAPGAVEPDRLCGACAELTATTGAGIMLIHAGVSRGSLCASDRVSELVEELQFTLGEGPCLDAWRDGRPVIEADLSASTQRRWTAFGPPAVGAGIRAVFAFPIRIGAAGLGALHLHRDRPGGLTDDQHADALVIADLAAEMILLLQAEATPGELVAELETGARYHYVVHQASGMVSAQLGVSVDEALVRLRAHAFESGVPLVDISRRVVERTLRFRPDDPDGSGHDGTEVVR